MLRERTNWVINKVCNHRNCTHLTVDNEGNVYFSWRNVTTGNTDIIKINSQQQIQHIDTGKDDNIIALCWHNDKIYMCNQVSNRILEHDLQSGKTTVLAGIQKSINRTKPNNQVFPMNFFDKQNTDDRDGAFDDCVFDKPNGITVDDRGNLYVCDQYCLRKLDMKKRSVTTIAGYNAGMADGEAKQARFHQLCGIAIDKGTVYLCDQYNQLIRKVQGSTVSTVAKDMSFKYPFAVATHQPGVLLVGDMNSYLKVVDFNRKTSFKIQAPELQRISAIATRNGRIVVSTRTGIYWVEDLWTYEKYLWLGHLKGDPKCCFLATLPKDIIREITKHILHSTQSHSTAAVLTNVN